MSADGNTAIVGGIGATFVYTRSNGVWTQQALLGTGAVSVLSADGNTVVGGFLPAAVYTRSGGVWTQQASVPVGTGAVGNAEQGTSLSLSADGNTVIVGGPGDSSNAGAAWIFTRSGNVWTQQGSKLVGTGAIGNAEQGNNGRLHHAQARCVMAIARDQRDVVVSWRMNLVAPDTHFKCECPPLSRSRSRPQPIER